MQRRQVFAALAGAAAAWPLAVSAEPARPAIGVLFPGASTFRLDQTFLVGLGEAGFIEGQNVTINYRFGTAWVRQS